MYNIYTGVYYVNAGGYLFLSDFIQYNSTIAAQFEVGMNEVLLVS